MNEDGLTKREEKEEEIKGLGKKQVLIVIGILISLLTIGFTTAQGLFPFIIPFFTGTAAAIGIAGLEKFYEYGFAAKLRDQEINHIEEVEENGLKTADVVSQQERRKLIKNTIEPKIEEYERKARDKGLIAAISTIITAAMPLFALLFADVSVPALILATIIGSVVTGTVAKKSYDASKLLELYSTRLNNLEYDSEIAKSIIAESTKEKETAPRVDLTKRKTKTTEDTKNEELVQQYVERAAEQTEEEGTKKKIKETPRP